MLTANKPQKPQQFFTTAIGQDITEKVRGEYSVCHQVWAPTKRSGQWIALNPLDGGRAVVCCALAHGAARFHCTVVTNVCIRVAGQDRALAGTDVAAAIRSQWQRPEAALQDPLPSGVGPASPSQPPSFSCVPAETTPCTQPVHLRPKFQPQKGGPSGL